MLTVRTADDRDLTFEGRRRDDGEWEFLAADKNLAARLPSRVTLRLAAEGKRLVMLLERRTGPGDNAFATLAEIGYTRGEQFRRGIRRPEVHRHRWCRHHFRVTRRQDVLCLLLRLQGTVRRRA